MYMSLFLTSSAWQFPKILDHNSIFYNKNLVFIGTIYNTFKSKTWYPKNINKHSSKTNLQRPFDAWQIMVSLTACFQATICKAQPNHFRHDDIWNHIYLQLQSDWPSQLVNRATRTFVFPISTFRSNLQKSNKNF